MAGESDSSQRMVSKTQQKGPVCWRNPQVGVFIGCMFVFTIWEVNEAVHLHNATCFCFAAREEDILWNSNIIAERVSPYVVKTITGRVYVLIGKMNLPVDSSE